jgi:hypothetical protein
VFGSAIPDTTLVTRLLVVRALVPGSAPRPEGVIGPSHD